MGNGEEDGVEDGSREDGGRIGKKTELEKDE